MPQRSCCDVRGAQASSNAHVCSQPEALICLLLRILFAKILNILPLSGIQNGNLINELDPYVCIFSEIRTDPAQDILHIHLLPVSVQPKRVDRLRVLNELVLSYPLHVPEIIGDDIGRQGVAFGIIDRITAISPLS